nr:hypothetical protein [Pedobacter sp. HDW13]
MNGDGEELLLMGQLLELQRKVTPTNQIALQMQEETDILDNIYLPIMRSTKEP